MNQKSDIFIQKSCNRHIRLQLGLAFLAQLFSGSRVQAENQVDYRYEYYTEDDNRMTIETHSAYFEQKLIDSVIAKGELTYDGISGATPTGANDGAGHIFTTQLHDIRRAISLEFDGQLANHTITPGFAYSKESDYESYGVSLNDAIAFNDKNTILQLGISHNFDSVLDISSPRAWQGKQSTEGIIGVSQLLSPKTIFDAAFTFGNDSGYLQDPYRVITFDLSGFSYPEIRPRQRNKEILYVGLTHYFDPVNGSAELSYRFYHDSYGVSSHAATLAWHQKLGKHFILEPLLRFYEQSSAGFYSLSANGFFPSDPLPRPTFYSADYRLSEFYSLDMGLQATVVVNDHLHIVAGYHRYEMYGLDNTPSATYPKANIFTVGLSILW